MSESIFPATAFNVSLVGVGGQGILLTSDILALAAMNAGYDVKKSEIHGMSQRGGSVISQVRFGEKIYSPIIPDGASDVLVSFERLEALRWLHLAKPDAKVLVNNLNLAPITVSSGQQPPVADEQARLAARTGLLLLDAVSLAREAGNLRTANVALVGALATFTPIAKEHWQTALQTRVPSTFLAVNQKAFELGYRAMS
ncbi:MAG: indolepyruvate oxidoreductase subunit beta [Verrucomicrobiota bacterium]|jgi:indolepyruvate ferredoxin oxidoreductase beta subunit|nr:indolepyruvate oxidoreductase subunit beta [Verrucomicrobiota bacterium]